MNSREIKPTIQQPVGKGASERGRPRLHCQIEHRITREDNAFFDPFTLQVQDGSLRWAKQLVRQTIGEDAVELFRHVVVVRSKPGLDMIDWNMQLRSGKRARYGRVRISEY